MKLYNTLTRQTDELLPLNPPKVAVYTCGPTVYDYAHIGHWFNYVRMDTLIRALKAAGLQPQWVMNITDVGHLVSDADEGEDKLEKGARREGKTAWQIADHYTQDFLQGMKQLNMLMPDHVVKATEHIAEQIQLIRVLEDKGYTYIIDDGVYYDTAKFEGYEAFARLDLDEQQATGRVATNPQKRNAADFALWKFSPTDRQRDMEWDSPWGKGFPGWHIECSAMSMKYLGETLDIHTGGIDHVPVHHTNEIAQSEAATGKRFALYWMHSNHVTVNGEKISKSLGNGIRLQEILERGISNQAVRLHILESHYRNQSRFSWESLDAAQNRLAGLQEVADLRWQPQVTATQRDYGDYTKQLIDDLTNDLDTPHVLAKINEQFQLIQTNGVHGSQIDAFTDYLRSIDSMLGLTLSERPDMTDEQKALLNRRQEARDAEDWEASDSIRDQLNAMDIVVRDSPGGQVWHRL